MFSCRCDVGLSFDVLSFEQSRNQIMQIIIALPSIHTLGTTSIIQTIGKDFVGKTFLMFWFALVFYPLTSKKCRSPLFSLIRL